MSILDRGVLQLATARGYEADKAALEAVSGGHCTIQLTAKGQRTYMRRLNRYNVEDLDSGLGTGTHEAFVVNGVTIPEVWVGMYPGVIVDDELLSLPGVDPTTSQNFDEFSAAGRACGSGFHLMTNAEWSAIMLLAAKSNWVERGNTQYGRSHSDPYEVGRKQNGGVPGSSEDNDRTLTGTGPQAWWTPNQIGVGWADLIGNVWEWVAGMRLVDGEIQVLPNNDAVDGDLSGGSAEWRALLEDGTMVAPGTTDTLKYDSGPTLSEAVVTTGSSSVQFHSMTADGVVPPAILQRLGLYPSALATSLGRFYANNGGERLPLRGGYWNSGSTAGLAACSLSSSRGPRTTTIGGRVASYPVS